MSLTVVGVDIPELVGNRLLKVNEAAKFLSVSRSKVYELLRDGRLESRKLDGSRRIPVSALETFLRSSSAA